jgi:hypothetical protein
VASCDQEIIEDQDTITLDGEWVHEDCAEEEQ